MDWEAFYSRFREPNFIPGYEIQNRLGGGAFGEVYKARKHSIGKAYAIKFLKVDDEAQRDAIERELEQVRHFAALDHPNLVTIEDLGMVMGIPYLIMGYAGEDTLARRLRHERLEREKALSYFVQACRGVLALHDRRLAHFDLKPSNIFIKGDEARVGDYGLSKMMADGRLTLSFGRGTPQYMAPEMLRNRADHRADIYSLGVILYELFAHKPPYESVVPGTLTLRETDEPPVFPPTFPVGLQSVVISCLRLLPEDRYPSVADLLVALGETPRRYENLRVNELAGTGPALVKPRPQATPQTPASSDARAAAAELARGAVEVARGVWDGLRTASGPRPGESGTPMRTGSEGLELVRPNAAPPPIPRAPMGNEVIVMHTLSGNDEAHDDFGTRIDPRALATAGVTIPVPPPVKGGWFGTLFSTAALALEMLVALARGLSGSVWRGVVRGKGAGAGAMRGLGTLTRSAFRLFLFLALLALLGGLSTLVFYAIFS